MRNFYRNKIGYMSLVSFLSIFIFSITLAPTTSFAIDFDVASANAGPDQTITLPTSQVTLSGSSTGVSGIVLYYTWTKLSGSGNIVSPTSATTDVTGLTVGTSVFRLTVTNNTGTTVTDDVNIFVNGMSGGGGGTGGATAYAGPDQTLRPLSTQTTLSGTANGISGIVIYYSWTKLSGSGNIVSPTSATTDVTGLDVGSATFRFTATNNTGQTAFDDVDIVVLPAGPQLNIPPTAYAGPDQILVSPVSSTILSGSGVDSDGSIVSYSWTKISGSGVVNVATGSNNGSVVSITSLTVGTSVFRLTVTDNLGATGTDDVIVVVNSSGGGTGGGGTGGSGGGTGGGTGGSGGGGGSGSGILCPFGVTGTPATCVLINIPKTGVKRTSGLVVIKDFQRFLNWSLGNKVVPLVVDGRWGAKTTAVIKLYQRLNSLKVDGSFGRLSAGKAITLLKNANLYRQ